MHSALVSPTSVFSKEAPSVIMKSQQRQFEAFLEGHRVFSEAEESLLIEFNENSTFIRSRQHQNVETLNSHLESYLKVWEWRENTFY